MSQWVRDYTPVSVPWPSWGQTPKEPGRAATAWPRTMQAHFPQGQPMTSSERETAVNQAKKGEKQCAKAQRRGQGPLTPCRPRHTGRTVWLLQGQTQVATAAGQHSGRKWRARIRTSPFDQSVGQPRPGRASEGVPKGKRGLPSAQIYVSKGWRRLYKGHSKRLAYRKGWE